MPELYVITNHEAHYDTMYRRYWPSTRRATDDEILQAAMEIKKRRAISETVKLNPDLIFEGVFELAKNGAFE